MDLVALLVAVIVFALLYGLLGVIVKAMRLDPPFPQVMNAILVVAFVLWLLRWSGLLQSVRLD